MRPALLAVAFLLLAAAPASAAPELVKLGDFTDPVHVTSPPNDPRVFVVEQAGRIGIAGGGTFLDLTNETLNGGERGLLSMAFAPDYASSGLLYVFLTSRPNGDIEIREYRGGTLLRTLLDEPHSASNHNGGQLQFGPDGALYASIGDNAVIANARDPASPFGKIHRIDTATGASSIWSSGLRNPWRFSFDAPTGDLLIGDVGSGSFEEINWSRAPNAGQGVDYGWGCGEGANQSCGTPAAFWHPNGPFCAIIGGLVVRDPGLPTLSGRYLYGDNCNAALWSRTLGANDGAETGLTVSGLSSFGTDSCGHVFVASRGSDAVYRIQDGAPSTCAAIGSPPGSAADTAAPVLSVRILRPALKRRRLRLAVRCGEPCRLAIAARFRRVKRLSTRHRSLAAGKRTVVPLKYGRATARRVRRALARRGRVRLAFTVRATDAAGNRSTVTRRGRIRR
jgi:Glucose / Sorbosone dehydrogenase